MHVSHLQLRDFRNYREVDLELGPGAHLFVGANGQGKTNLVEAIGYLASLGSHRVSSDAALVRLGAESAIARGELSHGNRRLRIEVQIAKAGSNRAQVGGRAVRARELSRYITTVLFAPEDLALVRGEPAVRRSFLDRLLVTHSPRLGGVLSDYDRVLRQRNSLLRSARSQGRDDPRLHTLEVWDDRLVDLGTEIVAERLRLVSRLVPHLERGYARLVGADHAPGIQLRLSALGQSTSVGVGDEEPEDDDSELTGGEISFEELRARFVHRLAERRDAEIERGVSLVGPHRDDAVIMLNGLPARITASQGESWSLALALKLAAAELVRAESQTGDPVLILDDVFSELDADRRERLADAIGDFEQVLVTAAVLGDIPDSMHAQVTTIRGGTIVGDGA
ncbi:DNA replication/repair protein RecF [Pseudoclavibacter chungangensis]|uniref:DNA replication and repair protein RecF n=1 Tax=Pseudoclavibacter chungangensis TaxID=587635 RepID=A0A7J5BQ12_9MICO|nr:DNA replication/repair protein RecF [Pseudoclavibacter chungangensis]KAB1655381.1 DNA replication/repair protein RecF [Pseudoclavibacter chungangensis]NYJ68333.1 DNA replication and repair protein RecF [Pseudoclavibacter chungangensis]